MEIIKKPLAGITVLITRAEKQAEPFAKLLKEHGADTVLFPTIEIVPAESEREIAGAVQNVQTYDYILFTSTNGVHYFMQFVEKYYNDPSHLKSVPTIAVGEKTKSAIESYGLNVSVTPSAYYSEGLAKHLQQIPMKGKRVLFPRGELGRELLIDVLQNMSAIVDPIVVYRTVLPQNDLLTQQVIQRFEQSQIDVVTFTSPSTLKNFLTLIGEKRAKRFLRGGAKIAVIGPTTKREADKYSVSVHVIAEQSTLPALTEAIVENYEKRSIPQSV